MATHLHSTRRIALGAVFAALVSTALVGVGFGVGTADEAPAAAPVASAAPAPRVAPSATPTRSAAPSAVTAPAPTTEAESTTAAPTRTPTTTAPTTSRAVPPAAVPVRAAAPPLVAGTPCTATAKACVDLGARTAWLIENGAVRRGPVSVMIGDEIDPTPLGTFRVEWKAEQWTSREYLTQMPYAVFFAEGGIAFHEGPQDTNSAGCVKLTNADAQAWFAYLQVGDEVQIR